MRPRAPLFLTTLRRAELLGTTAQAKLPLTVKQRLELYVALTSIGIDVGSLRDGLCHTTIVEDESCVMLPSSCGKCDEIIMQPGESGRIEV